MGFNVRPYLEQIGSCPPVVLEYFQANADSLSRNRLMNAFWELPCPMHDVIVEWFFSPGIAKIPFEAFGYLLLTQAK